MRLESSRVRRVGSSRVGRIGSSRVKGSGGCAADKIKPKFGSWIMGLAAKDAKIAKNR